MNLQEKSVAELFDILEEAECALLKEHCFCTFYNKDIISAGLEALRRLRAVANVVSGEDEPGFIVDSE